MSDGGGYYQGEGWGPPREPAPGSQQPGYGQPSGGWGPPPGYGYGYGPGYYAPATDGKAIGALVAAILSWVVCPVIPAVVALILASQSANDIAASRGRLTGEGFNTAARITAWLNLAVYGIGALFLLVIFMAGTTA